RAQRRAIALNREQPVAAGAVVDEHAELRVVEEDAADRGSIGIESDRSGGERGDLEALARDDVEREDLRRLRAVAAGPAIREGDASAVWAEREAARDQDADERRERPGPDGERRLARLVGDPSHGSVGVEDEDALRGQRERRRRYRELAELD